MCTPVIADRLGKLLCESGYPSEEIKFLVLGFTEGFDICYQGPTNRMNTARNIPFMVGDKWDMWTKITKEVKAGRFVGPFDTIPFCKYIQSPIGLVPKAG